MTVRTISQIGERGVWQKRAACRGPESVLFFAPTRPESRPERESREERAKAICGDCPVQRECLEYSLRIREPHGIWGGLNETERRMLWDPTADLTETEFLET
ncbi:MAG: WhiB family transcriptional regulator [Acidimicrobiia bacterium]|nr:WhiB family transcriptional regulator [Acidimicrobiia bacterium]